MITRKRFALLRILLCRPSRRLFFRKCNWARGNEREKGGCYFVMYRRVEHSGRPDIRLSELCVEPSFFLKREDISVYTFVFLILAAVVSKKEDQVGGKTAAQCGSTDRLCQRFFFLLFSSLLSFPSFAFDVWCGCITNSDNKLTQTQFFFLFFLHRQCSFEPILWLRFRVETGESR